MKRSEYLKLTSKQMKVIENGEFDHIDEVGLSEEQWCSLTLLLGSYQGDGNESFNEWIFGEME